MKTILDKIILSFIIFTGIALFSVLVISYYNTKKLKATSDLVENAQEVLNNSNNVLLDILNVETGARGYDLTGNNIYLQPFYIGSSKISSDIQILAASTKGNSNQKLRIASLKKAVEEIVNSLNNSIRIKKQNIVRADSLKDVVEEGFVFTNKFMQVRQKNNDLNKANMLEIESKEKLVVDNARNTLADINAEEFYLLKERKIESDKDTMDSQLIFLVLLILILALVSAIIINHRKRDKITEELNKSILIAEEAIKKSEEASKLKESFLANMSHEIRTPMNAIIGFADILSKGKLQEKEKEYVKIIKSAGENLLTIINDILDISKIEAGMMTLEEHTFSVKEIFNSLQVMLMGKAKEKNIELIFTCAEDIPDSLLGDPTRLTQIIINIVGNAIKFTQKGKVSVSAKILEKENAYVILEFLVKDTGIGIPPDKMGHIFERFRQAESQTTRKYGGTGLGLSIAKQLVELQGGTLSVKSELGVGSEFSFCIPYKNTIKALPVQKNIAKKYTIEELVSLNILLIEDNPLNIKLVLSLFAEYNLKLEVAENGSIGIEKLKVSKFSIILMDMEMPVMNGYEATTIIRKELKSNIPIIAMTAHAMAGEQEKCLSLGMNDYVSKPINADLLFEKIYNLTINV